MSYINQSGIRNNKNGVSFVNCSGITNNGDRCSFTNCSSVTSNGESCAFTNCSSINNNGDRCNFIECSALSDNGQHSVYTNTSFKTVSKQQEQSSAAVGSTRNIMSFFPGFNQSGSVFNNVSMDAGSMIRINGVSIPNGVTIRNNEPFYGGKSLTREDTTTLEEHPELVVFMDEWEARNGSFRRVRPAPPPAVAAPAPSIPKQKPAKPRLPDPMPNEASAKEDETKCSICMDRPVVTIIRKCNHSMMCITCAIKHDTESADKTCPICRQPYKRIERIYKS